MTKPINLEKYLARCTYTSKMLNSVVEKPVAWGASKLKIINKHRETMRSFQRFTEKLPEGWRDTALDTVAAGDIFTYPYRIKKYISRDRNNLEAEDIKFFRLFQDNPWFYTVFSIKENLKQYGNGEYGESWSEKDETKGILYEKDETKESLYENFFSIIDYSDGSEIILYSPGLRRMFERGANLFSALLFFNGYCYQTYGSLHYYKAFEPFDFDFFAKMLIPQYYKENGLSAAMSFRPLQFMLLDNWSEIPPVYHGKEQLTQCCHTLSLDSFESGKYSDKFTVKKKQGIIRLRLKRSKFPFNVSELYYDSKRKKFLVFTTGIKRYKKLVKLISEDISLPEVPELYATLPMVGAVKTMLGKDLPVIEYDRIFEGVQAGSREERLQAAELKEPLLAESVKNDELDKLNAFIGELTKRSNMGIDYSLKELSQLYDIPMETALKLENMLTKLDKRFSIDIDGGLSGFTPPPPDIRTMFRDRLDENKLFTVNTTEEAREDFNIFMAELEQERAELESAYKPELKPQDKKAKNKITFENFYDTLEDSAEEIWGSVGRTVLLYTFYMLCKKGSVFVNVRDYAVEFLKTFWQVILPDKKRKYLDEFIEDYSDFMFDVLFVYNIIDIDNETIETGDTEEEYLIKASAFFMKWIRLSDYFKE
ncbi:MAG: hypothetical protein J7K04_12515 [Spirochaetales bacterium]|nr:hypothetical protein [Spirochaetales bacterium]